MDKSETLDIRKLKSIKHIITGHVNIKLITNLNTYITKCELSLVICQNINNELVHSNKKVDILSVFERQS
jgi:hypothetical protein